ncbi:MAG: hypothetical protein ACTSQY_09155 [Candidatus Odinarchaeia archaeon]
MSENNKENTDKKVLFWIKRQIEDPITKILLRNANLTEIQLNTLLLDFLSEGFHEKKLSFEQKARLRRLKADLVLEGKNKKRKVTKAQSGVTRGAFNRVLKQARKNIIKAIYTVILLGYLGLFNDPRLQQYIELAEDIRDYSKYYEKAYEQLQKGEESEEIIKEYLKTLQKYLKELLNNLSEPISLKETTKI